MSETIKDKWKTWHNATLTKICDSLKQEYNVDVYNESFLFYKFLFQTAYAEWHRDIVSISKK